MPKQAKRIKAWTGDRDALHPLAEAVKLVKANATAKFDESIEIAVNLGVDPRHADQNVRGVVSLPSGTGRDVRVAVIAKDAKAAEATAAGADIVGAEDLVERIQGGFMEFDRVIATPDMMALVGRLGKVLGPRGLMPNPRVGTVTPERRPGREGRQGRRDRVPRREGRHRPRRRRQGRASPRTRCRPTSSALVDALQQAKPSGAKGTYIKRISLSSTMGPGFKVEPASIGRPKRATAEASIDLAMNSAGFSGSQAASSSSSAA